MKHQRAIWPLLALYVALAVGYSVATPLGEGPDEPGHMAYVFFLAREGRLPDQRQNEVPGEGHQPPLAYLLAVPAAVWLPAEQRQIDQPGNPAFVWAGGSEPNAVAHGSREYWPFGGPVLAWHLARLVSVLWGALTVWLLAGMFDERRTADNKRRPTNDERRTVDSGRRTAEGGRQTADDSRPVSFVLCSVLVLALNPQFLFVSGLVSNDALLTMWCTAVLALLWRGPGRGFGRYWAGVGALVGLALLTKQSALLLVPLVALGALVWHGWRKALLAGVISGSVVLVISGWWFARNLYLYGDLAGLAAFQETFLTQPFVIGDLRAWASALHQLHDSFWGRFGWMNIYAPWPVLAVFGALELLALSGWARVLVRQALSDRRWVLVLALALLGGVWVLAFALTAGLVAWQGRLLFPALPAIALLLGYGLAAWPPLRRRGAVLALSAVLALVAAALPVVSIRGAYQHATVPEQEALRLPLTPVSARYGKPGDPGADLRGWQAGSAQAGGELDVTLLWHAQGRQNRDWWVFLHLVDAQDTIVAEVNEPPRPGFPMTQWVAGDWLVFTHRVLVPPELAPGTYTLRVGLWDATGTQERAARYLPDGTLLGDALDLGTITIAP